MADVQQAVREAVTHTFSGNSAIKSAADLGAVGVLAGVFIDVLPAVVLFFTLIWAVARAYNEVMRAIHIRRDRKNKRG